MLSRKPFRSMIRIINRTESCIQSKNALPSGFAKTEYISLHSWRYKSHYTSLGLDSAATQKEIKSAYYELSLKHHPDKNNGSPESVNRFREIAEAYEVLGNPEKKKVYDQKEYSDTRFDSDFRRPQNPTTGQYYRARTAYGTGRTRYYNYDEHYRKHYDEYYRQQEAERETFRRRFEAERRHRYGFEYTEKDHEHYNPILLFRKKAFVYFFTFLSFLILTNLYSEGRVDRPVNKPVYYKVENNDPKIYYNVNKNGEDQE